jgi:phospholipid/cholesterol/gamma-HCH transport system permease protein
MNLFRRNTPPMPETLPDEVHAEYFNSYTYCRVASPRVTLSQAEAYEEALRIVTARLEDSSHKRLTIDLAEVAEYDSYLVVWIASFKRFCASRGIVCELQNVHDDMQSFIRLLEPPLLCRSVEETEETMWHRYVESVGKAALEIWADMRFFLEFLGEFTASLPAILRRSGGVRWSDFPAHITKAGVGAAPIVVLVGFLIGVIIAYQSAAQLSQFGAEVYLADMVAIAMARELAPLMTAIIVAGRSGAAFAAEIGTMRVSEEIDALETMGFNPMRFLVVPRVVAVVAVMPALVLFSDLAGMFGGLLIGVFSLKLSVSGYLNETKYALTFAHLSSGLVKSLALGAAVALIGCMRGFQVRGGADSVGHYTTSAVVTGIFLIIFLDAVFTVVFQALQW